MNIQRKIDNIIQKNNSLVCVGLDPVLEKLPEHLRQKENAFFEFNKAIIDATHDLVCAFKPNSAFYEALGDRGVAQLKMTCDYLRTTYPEVFIILDAKRGDIGSSNEGYVKYAFDYLNVDALTVMPYMGIESLAPFFNRSGRGIIIGCHSSNPGAKANDVDSIGVTYGYGTKEELEKANPTYSVDSVEGLKEYLLSNTYFAKV